MPHSIFPTSFTIIWTISCSFYNYNLYSFQTMDGGHLCVCVCGFLLSEGHMTHSIFPTSFTIIWTISDHFYNYNLYSFRPWMVVSFKTMCRYCFKRWTIPDPFQSLNTKGSIFKVHLRCPVELLNVIQLGNMDTQ
ncbi:hypothetical protein DVH24_018177 [Malus domestica]|uniref:Uncharacterized protein n=1 Tax=Malus domestica TaxID=3750 RepID=A0A498KK35_MALDO|nr:hypothetical protein DVH24_018177 [Malus domestica]